MFVEDLLLELRVHVIPKWIQHHLAVEFVGQYVHPWGLTAWHRDFIYNVSNHVNEGHSLSTKQSETFLKLVARFKYKIIEDRVANETEISNLLNDPTYRRPLYTSTNVPKEVRYIGNNFIAFRFKSNKDLLNKIKTLTIIEKSSWIEPYNAFAKIEMTRARFDWLHKIWIVPVYRYNLQAICNLILDARFRMDKSTAEYLQLALDSHDKPSLFAVDEQTILVNVCDDPILAAWITEIAAGIPS